MWIKIDDRLLTHPKIAPLTDAALALWLRGLVYCGQFLTDGYLPPTVVPRLGKAAAVRELVAARLWTRSGNRGYTIHDYLTYQPSRAKVLADQAFRTSLGRAGAAARWHKDVPKTDSATASKIPKTDAARHSKTGVTACLDLPISRSPVREEQPAIPDEAAARARLERLKQALAETLPKWPDAKRPLPKARR